ncbi:MAG: hypothetical protein H0V46_02610 [Sphingomonas sp.]|nr:hypothetical protein [Sphingomonas sp.]
MNPFEMVVIIVAIVMIGGVLKARHGSRHGSRNRSREVDGDADLETLRLRDEVKQLKERLHVLERITTDKENSLSREIEELRDR